MPQRCHALAEMLVVELAIEMLTAHLAQFVRAEEVEACAGFQETNGCCAAHHLNAYVLKRKRF